VPANYTFEDGLAGTDIVGPGESYYLNTLQDHWLGLDDLIAKNKTDLSVYPQALRNTFRNASGRLEGLPYIEYPAFIFYNKDLFEAAGLPDLPTRVGEKYMGADWTWDELATIAKQLTVDTSGRASTESGFDPAKTKSYGFDLQWVNDLRRFATAFGAGSYVATDGKTAQIPAVWGQAAKWYYDAMWTSHFAPTDAERSAADLGGQINNPGAFFATTVATGRVAMDLAWTWAIDSFGSQDASGNPTSAPPTPFEHWDMGVLPSNDGATTDPIDVDTFVINKDTRNPDAAYKTMLAIMADPTLMAGYGGLPVDPSFQAAYFKTEQAGVDAQFANNPITWSVLAEMTKYASPVVPFDPDQTSLIKATSDDQAFYTLLETDGGLNVDAEIAKLKSTLQADFDAPTPSP
jgi:multiple sugar transport system substrate-binding protein